MKIPGANFYKSEIYSQIGYGPGMPCYFNADLVVIGNVFKPSPYRGKASTIYGSFSPDSRLRHSDFGNQNCNQNCNQGIQ